MPYCRLLMLVVAATFSIGAAEVPSEVRTFLQQAQTTKIPFPGRGDLFNNYYQIPPQKPDNSMAIVFLPGMGEPALKYYELVNDLAPLNATIYLWDHLGQGLSFHFLPDQKEKVFIKDFNIHVEALTHFLLTLRPQYKKVFVIGHSMGGHLAIRAALNKPGLMDSLVLSSPLLGFDTNVWWMKAAKWLLPYMPETDHPPFFFLFKKIAESGINVTHDQKRMDLYRQTYTALPAIKRSGTTVGWLLAAANSVDELSKSNLKKLNFPVLLLQAEEERLVSNRAQTELCKKLPNCHLEVIKGSRHEIFFETDPMRKTALNLVLEAVRKN